MTPALKPAMESFARILLAIIVLFNAILPTTALAMPPGSVEPSAAVASNNTLPSMRPVIFQPHDALPNPGRFSPQADEGKPETPGKDSVEFSISTSKGEVEGGRTVTINVLIQNNSDSQLNNLTYYDILEKGLEFGSSADRSVK